MSNSSKSEISWNDKMRIKTNLSEDNKIEAKVEDVEIQDNVALIKLSPLVCDIAVELELDSTFKLHKDSEFELFLKDHGIAPTEDDIVETLEGEEVEIKVEKGKSYDTDIVFTYSEK